MVKGDFSICIDPFMILECVLIACPHCARRCTHATVIVLVKHHLMGAKTEKYGGQKWPLGSFIKSNQHYTPNASC